MSVASILRSHVDRASGELGLPKDALGPYVKAMLDAYVDDAIWRVAKARVNDGPANSAILKGTGISAPFAGMTIDGTFKPPETTVTAAITATPPTTGWTLGNAFPKLTDTFIPYLDYGSAQTLTLKCESTPAASGLAYSGALKLTGGLAALGAFLYPATTDEVLLDGSINVQSGLPQLALSAPATSPKDLLSGKVKLDGVRFSVEAEVTPASGGNAATVSADLALSTSVSFVTVPIPLKASYNPNGGGVQLAAQADKLATAGLQELSALLAGQDPTPAVPERLRLEKVLRLTDVIVHIDPEGPAVQWVQAGVQTDSPWPLITGSGTEPAVTVDEISLIFRYYTAGDTGLTAFCFGEISIGATGKLEVAAVYPGFAVSAGLKPGTSLNLTEVVEHFFSIPDAPAIVVTEFEFEVARPAYSGSLTIGSDWPIPIGPGRTLTIEGIGFSFDHPGPGTTTGKLTGSAMVVGARVDVEWNLPGDGDFRVSATIPSRRLSELIGDFSTQPLVGIPDIELSESSMYLEKDANGGYYASFSTIARDFGQLEVDFFQIGGTTGFAAGFSLDKEWSLADLSTDLKSLAFLKFEKAALIVASAKDPNFRFTLPFLPPTAPTTGVDKGVALYAEMLVEGDELSVIRRLFSGVSRLDVTVVFPANYEQTTIQAEYRGTIPVYPKVAVIDRLALVIMPGEPSFAAVVDVTFTLRKDTLKLHGSVEFVDGQLDLSVATDTAWRDPFGIRGLTIEAAAFELALKKGALATSLGGTIKLGTGENAVWLTAEVEFNASEEFLPDVIRAEEVGTIDLGEALNGLLAKPLPAELVRIRMSNFHLLAVGNPNGWKDPVGKKFYRSGLAFGGTLELYGLTAVFEIDVDYATGISATGQLDKALKIGPFLTLTAADRVDKGPSFSISTTAPVHVSLTAALTLFEISQTVVCATVTDDAFTAYLRKEIVGLSWVDLYVSVQTSVHVRVNAECQFTLRQLGPIRTPLGFDVGRLRIDLDLAARFGLEVQPTSVALALAACFEFENIKRQFGPITPNVTITQLSDVAKAFADELAKALWNLAADVFQDAEKLVDAAENRVIALSDDVAVVLRVELNSSLDRAAALLARAGPAMGYDAVYIAQKLSAAYGSTADAIAAALRSAGYDPSQIAKALVNTFWNDEQRIAKILLQIGFTLAEIAQALWDVWKRTTTEIAQFFRDVLNVAGDVVEAALTAIGLPGVGEAMEAVFDWVADVVEDAGYYLNPSNW